jgi:hypothetical protein
MVEQIKKALRALVVGSTLLLHPADASAEPINIRIEEIYTGDGYRPQRADEKATLLAQTVLDHPKVADEIAAARRSLVVPDGRGGELVKAIGIWRHVVLEGPPDQSTHVIIEAAQAGQLSVRVFQFPKDMQINVPADIGNLSAHVSAIISY